MPLDKSSGSRHHAHKSAEGLPSASKQSSSRKPRRSASAILREPTKPSSSKTRQSSIAKGTPSILAESAGDQCLEPSTKRPARAPSEPVDNSNRDSFHSILEDPFFQDYGPDGSQLQPLDLATHEPSPIERDEKESTHNNWPPPRRESLTIGMLESWRSKRTAMESFHVAVIGARGVGKSCFIQAALALQSLPMTEAPSIRSSVDGVTHMVTALELDVNHFEASPSQQIQWPKQINGHIVPRVDAAIILYDVTARETTRPLTQILAAVSNAGMPSILVANKCETAEDDWHVDVDDLAKRYYEVGIATYKASATKPEAARSCLQSILRAAVSQRREDSGEQVARRRAQSNLEAPEPMASRSYSGDNKHSRASSEFSLLKGFNSGSTSESHRQQSSISPRPPTGFDNSNGSFLHVEESDTEQPQSSDDIPLLQRNDNDTKQTAKEEGVAFGELVDRLLAPRISKTDADFSDIFLCLYRKFAAPGELFAAILARLDRVRDDKAAHYLSRTATQLRIIEVVARWVALYPGDFARPTTKYRLDEFIKHLSTEPIFSIAAQQMRRNLNHNVVEDDDTGWAHADDVEDDDGGHNAQKETNEVTSSLGSLQFEDADGRPSEGSEADRADTMSNQFQYHSYEEYEREAALLEPSNQLPMNKFRYHIFMDVPVDDIAEEMTRIDWIMFSSMRIRDLVRHVSLSAADKAKCQSLKNVDRTIAHFNHLARWVTCMILLRDKAKHRAQMLEKFMNIATKLRQLNNYNGLAAVVAGINSTPINRLLQTHALVSETVGKRFAKNLILTSTTNSYFAYRLAWQNSPLPRIPYMAVHRRDLVQAEVGSKTFVGAKGDKIHWAKFHVLGSILLPIMKSQGSPYPSLSKHETVRETILGCKMPVDEVDIDRRSEQVENSQGGGLEAAKKKGSFPWFNRTGSAVNARRLQKHGDSHVVLQCSMTLDLPPEADWIASAVDLKRAVDDKQLWIEKKDASFVNLSVANLWQGLTVDDLETLEHQIKEFELWARLGVRLVAVDPLYSAEVCFSLQHPDISSALVAPEGVLAAKLIELHCLLDVSTKFTEHADLSKANVLMNGTRARRKRKRTTSSTTQHAYTFLDPVDQRAIEEYMGLVEQTWTPPATEMQEIPMHNALHGMASFDVVRALETSLDVLMIGVQRKHNGYRVMKGESFFELASLAPGVFNMSYLKAIAGRVSAMSVISTSLARMVDAESPELRRKAMAFGVARGEENVASSPLDKVRHGIQEGAWATLLRHTKRSVPKRSPGQNRSTQPAIEFDKDFANGVPRRPSQLADSFTWSQSEFAPEMSHTAFMSFNNPLPPVHTRQPTLWVADILE
ncbi:RasGEF protein [Emericellopsis atlantica]|uniref:RasGEF protein n=1 Tax=Emericellopsis atlantica TaxID=2614577 RepID=A0A9P8CS30_9HYPO|nr:RasGEF protein [Emericellopsis atlantica]KAG9257398.1 RasGEF protein [Emericellopsis atlantica]